LELLITNKKITTIPTAAGNTCLQLVAMLESQRHSYTTKVTVEGVVLMVCCMVTGAFPRMRTIINRLT